MLCHKKEDQTINNENLFALLQLLCRWTKPVTDFLSSKQIAANGYKQVITDELL